MIEYMPRVCYPSQEQLNREIEEGRYRIPRTSLGYSMLFIMKDKNNNMFIAQVSDEYGITAIPWNDLEKIIKDIECA